MGEAMLNHWAQRLGKDVRAFSAGSQPSGRINPQALRTLANVGIETTGLRSKSWDEFVPQEGPSMRIVITVCHSAASEQCPYWPGGPVKAHWGYPDPSLASEADRENAFELTRQALGYRMIQLLQLPLETMGDRELQDSLINISRG